MSQSRTLAIRYKGNVEHRDAAAELLSEGGDVVLVERGRPRMLVLRCPCGCGDDLLINLDRRAGRAWGFYRNRLGLTIYPSFWREDGCESHFILWNDRIYWCYGWESEQSDSWEVSEEIETKVYDALPRDSYAKYYDLAEPLALIPWEVLQACRQLVTKGKVVAGNRKTGEYRRLSAPGT